MELERLQPQRHVLLLFSQLVDQRESVVLALSLELEPLLVLSFESLQKLVLHMSNG